MSKPRKCLAMLIHFGELKNGKTCKDCCHLKKFGWRGKNYYKCQVYGISNSEATDWRTRRSKNVHEKSVMVYGIAGRADKGGVNMYEATRQIREVFSADCQTARTGSKDEVLKQKEKWEYIYSKAWTKAQINYCRRILKAINISMIKFKYQTFKEKGGW